MKSIFNKFITIVFVSIILLCWLKGCSGTIYRTNEIKVFQNTTTDGEVREIYLLPKNRLIISRKFKEFFDISLFEIKGSSITHYVGSLYNTGGSLFSLKIYPDVLEAYKIEARFINSWDNVSESAAYNEKSIHYLLIRDKSIEFDEEYFDESKIDKSRYDYINSLLTKLEK